MLNFSNSIFVSLFLISLAFYCFQKDKMMISNFTRKLSQYPNIKFFSQRIYNPELIKVQALNMLGQKKTILNSISQEDYLKKVPSIYNSSVGSHMRHSLDHYEAIVKAYSDEMLSANYDERKRNTEIEIDKYAALKSIEKLEKAIELIDLNTNIKISFIGETISFKTYDIESFVGRELSFASHHAIHHMSMITLIMQSMSYDLSKNPQIGIAPSTVKEMKKSL